MSEPVELLPRRWVGIELLVAGVAAAGTIVAIGAARVGVVGTAEVTPAWIVVDGVVAVVLIAAGAAAVAVGCPGLTGVLTTALGLAWLAPDWVAWTSGPAAARAAGIVVAPLLLPFLVHLALVHPPGRAVTARARASIAAAYVISIVLGVGLATVYDPFFDPRCLGDCLDNPLLVSSRPRWADRLEVAQPWWWLTASTALILWVARWTVATTATARRVSATVMVAVVVTAVTEGARAVFMVVEPGTEPPTAILYVRAAALGLLGLGVVRHAYRYRRRRAALGALVESLEPGSGVPALEDQLVRSLGDDALTVSYVLDDGRSVRGDGQEVSAPVAGERGRVTTTVTRAGRPLALIVHDAGVAPVERLGAAARLAVDNQRLRAGTLNQLTALQASRRRIVREADGVRRSMERDLHDGAQQRLVAATFELRMAAAAARQAGDPNLAVEIERLHANTRAALEELREVAHGIFPAVLDELGLVSALRWLATRSRVPIEIHAELDHRPGAETEMTAFRLVDSWAAGAEAWPKSVEAVEVAVRKSGDRLIVEARDVGVGRPQAGLPDDVADRVGAVGGELAVTGGRISAELPCVS